MLSQRIRNFIKSYVVVSLNAQNFEKVLNVLRRKNIKTWDIVKQEKGIRFKLSKKDFEGNKQFFEDANIKPVRKIGLMFKLNKLYLRVGFCLGVLLILAYTFIFCSFAWDIKIIGNEGIKKADIINFLNESNIKTPIKINKIDKNNIEALIYKKFKEVKFAEVYVEGVNIVIFVREKKEIEYTSFDTSPTSIVSNKQAVVYKAIVKHGELLVNEGDVVSEGQLLVQGTKKDKDNNNTLISSDATIFGYTYYNITLSEPKLKSVKKETGKSNTVTRLVIKDKKIKIFGNEHKFKEFDSKIQAINIPLISDFLNISFEKVKQYEVVYNDESVASDYAENKLIINLYEKLVKLCNKNAKIDKKDIIFEETEKEYIIKAKIQMIEDIGEVIKIYSLKED